MDRVTWLSLILSPLLLNIASAEQSDCETKPLKLEYAWSINNFSRQADHLYSATFNSVDDRDFEWFLSLSHEKYVTAFLHYKSGPRSAVKVNYEISLLESSRAVARSINDSSIVEKGGVVGPLEFYGNDSVLTDRERFEDDKIVILVKLTAFVEICKFERFVNSEKYSDVVLIVRDQRIYAHRIILAVESRVFSSIFESNITQAPVEIVVDFDVDVVKEALRYMYTGKVRNMNKMAKDLLTFADMYEIDGLKALCEIELGETLNSGNYVDILRLADEHDADDLKRKAIEVFLVDPFRNLNSLAVNELKVSNPRLNAELFRLALIDSDRKQKAMKKPAKKSRI